jgi:hypothetical protein
MVPEKAPIWTDVVTLARRLHEESTRRSLTHEDCTKLVKVVLEFQDAVAAPVSARRSKPPSRPSGTNET